MLENSRKRSRKAKLELREGVELEEVNFLYMQVKKEFLDTEVNESEPTNENAVTEANTDTNSEIDPFHNVAPTPTIDHQPLMEFSVKVEVEECDVTDMNDSNTELRPDEEVGDSDVTTSVVTAHAIKIDSDVTTSVVTANPIKVESDVASVTADAIKVDSDVTTCAETATSNVFKATSAIKPKIKVESNKNAEMTNTNDRSLLKKDAKAVTEFKEYFANRLMILRIVDRLLKSSNVADRLLAIEVRNYAGRTLEQAKDYLLQNVLEEWNIWYQEHSAVRDSPLLYKCYLCGNSFWHLNEFKEHVQTHNTLKHAEQFQVTLETNQDECYFIYTFDHSTRVIVLPDSSCFKCGKPAKTHTFADISVKNYKCFACKLTFSTCTQLSMHEMKCMAYKDSLGQALEDLKQCSICESGFYTEQTLQEHLTLCHVVRSDLVTSWELTECPICLQLVIVAALHICPKKPNNYGCNYCGRSFQKKIYKELHINNCHKSTQCRLCFKFLMAACMEPSHLLQHTDKFALMYKCLECSIGRYFPDENSIIHHTQTSHNRQFEKKFKYLEMVILPKQCLEKVSKRFQTAPKPRRVGPIKVTEIIPVLQPLLPQKRKLSDDYTMQVVVMNTPEDGVEQVKVSVETDKDKEKEIERTEDLQKSNSNSDEDDVVLIERENDVISLDSSSDSCEETTHEPEHATHSKRGRRRRYPCVCGMRTTASKLAAHRERCAVVRARRKRNRTPSTQGAAGVKLEDDAVENNDSVIDDDETNDHQIDDDNCSDDEKREIDESRERPYNRYSSTYVCKCKFKGNLHEFRQHRMNCDEDKFVVKRAKYTKEPLLTCTKCKNVFYSLNKYCKHFNIVHGYGKHTCPVCMGQFETVTRLGADIMWHVRKQFVRINIRRLNEDLQSSKHHACKDCQLPFDSNSYLTHWETHLKLKDAAKEEPESDKELHIVDQEDSLFDSELMKKILEQLQSMETRRAKRSEARRCVVCSRRFSRKNDAKRHLVEHLLADAVARRRGRRDHCLVCQICAAELAQPQNYKHHMRRHGSLPLYQCELCSKSFSDSSNFCKHKKVHSLATLRCNVCDKKFMNGSCLAKHMEMHERTKPSVCKLCDRVFHTRSEYLKHYRGTHERARHTCNICRASFGRLRDKWDHMWTEHEERQIKADCPLCEQGFRRFSDVKAHVRYEHGRSVRRTPDGQVVLVCQASHATECQCCPIKPKSESDKRSREVGYGPRIIILGPQPQSEVKMSQDQVMVNSVSENSADMNDMMEIVFKVEADDAQSSLVG